MPVSVKLNYLRIAPRKVRLLADLVRGKSVQEALDTLNFTVKKSARPLLKLLKQAVADAKNNFQLETADLYISKITVDEGPKNKRWRPRSRGQAYEIQKKTSHITVVLGEKMKTGKKGKKAKGAAEKVQTVEPVVEKAAVAEKTPSQIKPSAKWKKFEPADKRRKMETGKETVKKIFKRKAF